MRELDHLHIDLNGPHLIEASAGTGKTYAIALLYLRILVELKLEPAQILVVTYTEAATKELRGRIRKRIREALDAIDRGASPDPLLDLLCKNINGRWGDGSEVRDTLDRALKSFDTASIFTIHGFCLRALQQNAFESGSRYDTELSTDQAALMTEIVDDFWRQTFFRESSPILKSVIDNDSPDTLYKFARAVAGKPGQKLIPEYCPEQKDQAEATARYAFEKVQNTWIKHREEIVNLVSTDKGLSRGPYKAGLLPKYFKQLDDFAAGSNPFDLPESFALFCRSGIEYKPKSPAPVHPFFDCCEELKKNVDDRMALLKGELIAYCSEQLPLRKQQRNTRFFDDLMYNLSDALDSEKGAQLAAKLRDSYRAALIDEFQDTDPAQYHIFKKIHGAGSCPLFLIGDPKQAIYSFRGADIFAYIQAAEDIEKERRFTLTSNWRSTPELLSAFNRIFSSDRNPFIYDQIEYHPVAAGKANSEKLTTSSGHDAPLQLCLMPSDLGVTKAGETAVKAVAFEISSLLCEGAAGTALIGEKPLVPGDIAVIVRSHRQAKSVRDTLVPLGIPCVLRGDMTIFETDEAREVTLILDAFLNPASSSAVRASLLTDILGRTGSDLAALIKDEKGWETCLENFREYHQLWHDRGFMVMARLFISREGVKGRLLKYKDGERRLTNLLHCLEVIHAKAHERAIGMEGLVRWFTEKVNAVDKAEENELRLETDEQAVRIITVHVSKGLEYPVVFCPFQWGGVIENEALATFHDDYLLVRDYGSDDFEANRVKGRKELLAEGMRLLYVAVTRAKYRCYLYCGKVNQGASRSAPETSSLAYLFNASPETRKSREELIALLATDFLGLSSDEFASQYAALADGSGGAISADPLPDGLEPCLWQDTDETIPSFDCKKFRGTIENNWRVASFTSFVAHESKAAELPDRDESIIVSQETNRPARDDGEEFSIFTFPKGARAGVFMHGIFEKLNFTEITETAIEKAVDTNLARYGFRREWKHCICDMVRAVLRAPLKSGDGEFTLAELKEGSWLTELEFFFPLKFITSDRLRRTLNKYSVSYPSVDLEKVLSCLQFKPVQGMVRGFMDMVFEHGGRYYLLDWKSNHLGNEVESYNKEAMRHEMERNLYPLQYLLYSVALNQYLAIRVKDYDYNLHFGGVFYIFLRAAGSVPENGQYGIFTDLPPFELVKALTDEMVCISGERQP